jgi:hypothetical protein
VAGAWPPRLAIIDFAIFATSEATTVAKKRHDHPLAD